MRTPQAETTYGDGASSPTPASLPPSLPCPHRDAPRPARLLIRLIARVSSAFQRVILFAFPAVCWLYNAGLVFSLFVSVVFWGGPALAAYEAARACLREVRAGAEARGREGGSEGGGGGGRAGPLGARAGRGGAARGEAGRVESMSIPPYIESSAPTASNRLPHLRAAAASAR